MHASQDVRLVRFLDGLSMSFVMLGHIKSELDSTSTKLPAEKDQLPIAFWLCWSFIDTVHRIREMAEEIPGLRGNNHDRRVFLETTADAEKFRNYIQHLRGELSGKGDNRFPVWGALSWVDSKDPQLSYIAFAGAQVGETHYHGSVYNLTNNQFVSRVCLTVNEIAFHFDPAFVACMRFRDFVIPWIMETYKPGINVTQELPIIAMRFTPDTIADTGPENATE